MPVPRQKYIKTKKYKGPDRRKIQIDSFGHLSETAFVASKKDYAAMPEPKPEIICLVGKGNHYLLENRRKAGKKRK